MESADGSVADDNTTLGILFSVHPQVRALVLRRHGVHSLGGGHLVGFPQGVVGFTALDQIGGRVLDPDSHRDRIVDGGDNPLQLRVVVVVQDAAESTDHHGSHQHCIRCVELHGCTNQEQQCSIERWSLFRELRRHDGTRQKKMLDSRI